MRAPESATEILAAAAVMHEQKSAEYGHGYLRHGEAMFGLFPEGITLTTADDFARFALFDLLLVKMVRYAGNFAKSHRDSIKDIIVYAAMLEEFHESIDHRRRAGAGAGNSVADGGARSRNPERDGPDYTRGEEFNM